MASLEKIITVTPKHSLDIINLANGTISSTIQFDAGSMAREPLFIDTEHCIVPKGERYLAIVNTKSGQLKQQWPCPEQLKSMHLSHNRAYFFGGAISGKVFIWHFTTGELLKIFDAHYKGVSQITTNEDDSILFTTGLDGTVHVWNVASLLDVRELNSVTAGTRLKALVAFSRHSMPITSLLTLPGAANAGKMYTSSLDRTVIEYCVSSKSVRQLWTLPAPVLSMCINPNLTQLFVGCTNNEIYMIPLYDTTYYQTAGGSGGDPSATSSSSELGGMYMPSGSVYKQHQVATTSNLFGSGHVFPSFIGHTHHVTSLSISLHATHLVSTSLDGTVIIWSIGSRQIVKKINLHQGKHYPIQACKVIFDTPGALRVNDDSLRKKQFPQMLRDLRAPLELGNDQNNLRYGTNCFTTVPLVPQFNSSFQIWETLDDSTYSDHLLSLIDAENAIADCDGEVCSMTTPNTMFNPPSKIHKRSHHQMAHHDDSENDDDDDDDSTTSIKKHKGTDDADDQRDDEIKSQGKKIQDLEAELKKWKTKATQLFKQQQQGGK